MPCQACLTRVKTWQGEDPKCAFENGTFSNDNWNCATVSKIRHISWPENNPEAQFRHCESQENYSTLDISEIHGVENAIALWVQWYKNRGRTQAMWLLFENKPPRPPTEAECVLISNYYNKQVKG